MLKNLIMHHLEKKAIERQYLFSFGSNTQKIIFLIALLLCCTPYVEPATALFMGLIIAQLSGHPYLKYNHRTTHFLLQFSVVGLGFGMNAHSAITAGKNGFFFTIFSIASTLLLGYFLGKIFKTENKTSHLINSGTAICGGSAIAAIAPVIKANEKQISVALGIVFILNSIALIIFPIIGHSLHLTATQFGTWCAIAIHDTSSVVGAASQYGDQALEVATTIKLARALWIIPLAVLSGLLFKNKNSRLKIPYFIFFFILAMVFNTYFPGFKSINNIMVSIAKTGLTITLFLIGAGLSRQVVKSVGFKPLLQGTLLWVFIASITLFIIIHLL